MTKLYCYVDESGQDTQGRMFIVSVVITEKSRGRLFAVCEKLEDASGKKKDKWGRAKHERRMFYIRHILADARFKGVLRFEVFRNTKDYDGSTITAIISSVNWDKPHGQFTTLVYVDGLSKTKRQEYGARLRRLGLPVRKIRGIARDETNALTRLADATAGFIRDALIGKSKEIKSLFEKAKKGRFMIEVSSTKNRPQRGGRA